MWAFLVLLAKKQKSVFQWNRKNGSEEIFGQIGGRSQPQANLLPYLVADSRRISLLDGAIL